jgi:hypothetical protein
LWLSWHPPEELMNRERLFQNLFDPILSFI